MRNLYRVLLGFLLLIVAAAGMLFLYPRPPDTTAARVFAGDGATLDYCQLPPLDGNGPTAAEIPKAYTPDRGWKRWPMPVLAVCREPLASGVEDLRGLWQSIDAGLSHIERIEQCGNRTVVTSAGVIHDFVTDGTLANGSRDIEPPFWMNTWVSVEWQHGVMRFHPFGLSYTIVTRYMQGNQLVWTYPALGVVPMQRICHLPPGNR